MPALGEIKIVNGVVYRWNGSIWERITGPKPLKKDEEADAERGPLAY